MPLGMISNQGISGECEQLLRQLRAMVEHQTPSF
jgi:hypothetical protein